jgi:hypothetical protein
MVFLRVFIYQDGKPCKNQQSTSEDLDERHTRGTLKNQ